MFDTNSDNDAFTFLEDNASKPVEAAEPPVDLLTTQQVESVRFIARGKGYDYRQVEAFVNRVHSSVDFYQKALKTIEASYQELAEDSAFKDEKITQLKSTIEVFRAKGDPMVSGTGEYVTESVIRESDLYQRLLRENHALTARMTELEERVRETESALDAARAATPVVEPVVVETVVAQEVVSEPVVDEVVSEPVVEEVVEDFVSEPVVDEIVSEPVVEAVIEDFIVEVVEDFVSEPVVEEVVSEQPVATKRSLLAFAPEAAGIDLSQVPEEKVETITRKASLDDAPEAQR